MLEPTSVNCVIYHADCTDGFGAAYSAWKCLGNRAEYHACKHGTTPPDVKGKNVVILDFSFNNATTKEMIEKSKELHDGFDCILDATHPFALEISSNLFDVCRELSQLLIRFERPLITPGFVNFVSSFEELSQKSFRDKRILFYLARQENKGLCCGYRSGLEAE